MKQVIKSENLSFGYDSASPLLDDLSFNVQKGEFLSIAGPNGVGKSTLLHLLCGLLQPDSGRVEVFDKDITTLSRRDIARSISIVEQNLSAVFEYTVEQTVAMARSAWLGTLGFESEKDLQVIRDALEMTDTARFADRSLNSLSGGERQRVFIARAIAQDTPLLFLDEPTSFLDLKHQLGIYELLKRIQREKHKTLITVTHDINLACRYSDRVLLLSEADRWYIGQTENILTAELLEKVFSVKMFSAEFENQRFFLPLKLPGGNKQKS
jgi:iron complex transport system ATP-binding protein